MKKVLFVATVVQKHINVFHLPFLKMFQNAGWETAVCARNDFAQKEDCKIPYCDTYYDMPFERNPFKVNNLKVFKRLKALMKEEKYDIVHCHTPTGGVLARLAAFASGHKSTRVIYTAHGFHFFKGAPLLNWLLYFPVEWFCSFFTDVLITINKEDYMFAQKHMHAKEIQYVPGVGLDTNYDTKNAAERVAKRKEMGVPEDGTILLSVGEVNENKNHILIVKALAEMQNSDVHYCIAGKGDKQEELEKLAEESGILEQLHFLGYRTDIMELLGASDIFCFPSFREGLPVSVMEAMVAGLPCVATKIRGNTDLIENGRNGILVSPSDVNGAKRAIENLVESRELRDVISQNNREDVKTFDFENVEKIMSGIYGI